MNRSKHARDSTVSRLLDAAVSGDAPALREFVEYMYPEMRRIAHLLMAGERREHTLRTTGLVHESFLRILQRRSHDWQGPAHFLNDAALAMRRILIEHARAHRRRVPVTEQARFAVSEEVSVSTFGTNDILALDAALKQLERLDRMQAHIIELRFFACLTIEETAELLQISTGQVNREYKHAKAWLHRSLTRDEREPD